MLFDAKAGRVRKLTESYTVGGNIDVGGGGGVGQAIRVSLGMKTTITASDTEPKVGK